MRIRKTNAIIGVSLAVGALFMIYLVVDTLSIGYEDPEVLQVGIFLLYVQLKLPYSLLGLAHTTNTTILLNRELVWYSDHGDLFPSRMVPYSDARYHGSLVFI